MNLLIALGVALVVYGILRKIDDKWVKRRGLKNNSPLFFFAIFSTPFMERFWKEVWNYDYVYYIIIFSVSSNSYNCLCFRSRSISYIVSIRRYYCLRFDNLLYSKTFKQIKVELTETWAFTFLQRFLHFILWTQ